ncbi:MAG: arsenate reductase (glutaredoxin) [Urechidicola sp.]|jgi:arsenate reductase
MIQILHNPRCSKSRQGLEILKISGKKYEVVKYLENTLTKKELTDLIKLLNITPTELIRKGEAIWKDNYKGKKMTDTELIEAMVSNPKLIERPIVINNNKAVIGRPIESISAII